MFVPTTSIIFGWVLSHFFIGAQRLFLVLTIISSVQEYHQIEETKHLTCCDKLYAEQPYKSPHDGTTVQGIRRLGGLIHGLERRTPTMALSLLFQSIPALRICNSIPQISMF